jgi:hypothetical protein
MSDENKTNRAPGEAPPSPLDLEALHKSMLGLWNAVGMLQVPKREEANWRAIYTMCQEIIQAVAAALPLGAPGTVEERDFKDFCESCAGKGCEYCNQTGLDYGVPSATPRDAKRVDEPGTYSLTLYGLPDKKEAKRIAEDVYGDTFRWEVGGNVLRAYPGMKEVVEIRQAPQAARSDAPKPSPAEGSTPESSPAELLAHAYSVCDMRADEIVGLRQKVESLEAALRDNEPYNRHLVDSVKAEMARRIDAEAQLRSQEGAKRRACWVRWNEWGFPDAVRPADFMKPGEAPDGYWVRMVEAGASQEGGSDHGR